jgi:hypothetical protein
LLKRKEPRLPGHAFDATPIKAPSSTRPTRSSCRQKYNPTCTHLISHKLLRAKKLMKILGAFCNQINTSAVKDVVGVGKTDQPLASEPVYRSPVTVTLHTKPF